MNPSTCESKKQLLSNGMSLNSVEKSSAKCVHCLSITTSPLLPSPPVQQMGCTLPQLALAVSPASLTDPGRGVSECVSECVWCE